MVLLKNNPHFEFCAFILKFSCIFAADILESLLYGKNKNRMRYHPPAQGLETVTINILIYAPLYIF